MKKLMLIAVASLIAASSFAQWNNVKRKGKIKEGRVAVWTKSGELLDSGVDYANLTNVVDSVTINNETFPVEDGNINVGTIVDGAVMADLGTAAAADIGTGADDVLTIEMAESFAVDLATIEMVSKKNQPNGYVGLNEEGKIDAEIVETITVVFVGGPAVDVP